MDFHRFPFGFDGDDQAARHEDLVRYLQEELGEFMAPDWLGRNRQTTLNDLWALNRTLIVTYQVTQWSDPQKGFLSRFTGRLCGEQT